MLTHLRKDARTTASSSASPATPVTWPTLACHLEATPWAGLYDGSDEFIHSAVRGDAESPADFAQRQR